MLSEHLRIGRIRKTIRDAEETLTRSGEEEILVAFVNHYV
jgi:hypothetical protein